MQSLVGEKFSGLFISTLYFIIPILLFSRKSVFHFLFRFKKTIIFSSFIVFLLILSSYASIRSAGTSDALDALSTRILLQGQMWWAVDSVSDLGNLKNLAIIIHHYFGFGTEYEGQGMYYLMQQISPPEVFERYKNAGITFTMASPVNNIYFFGYYLSVIPVSIIGIFCGLSFWMLYRSFVVKDYILLFVAMKFYFMMFRVATMGDTGYLYSYKTVVYLLVIIFYCLMSGFKKRTFQ
ncbi:DUF6418 domain-containing protein [Rahnella victoriana]|uniref:DUF6418 domain-containing protein n=1 Tax=Rahnella victoriana TaxID=1510570 RepID=UPI001E641D09|nr:DUF6418 domain-containing protein [Rahnella victoriana]UHM89925.1 DUF6418 domain-containing protein [Rahnella victoriana]